MELSSLCLGFREEQRVFVFYAEEEEEEENPLRDHRTGGGHDNRGEVEETRENPWLKRAALGGGQSTD